MSDSSGSSGSEVGMEERVQQNPNKTLDPKHRFGCTPVGSVGPNRHRLGESIQFPTFTAGNFGVTSGNDLGVPDSGSGSERPRLTLAFDSDDLPAREAINRYLATGDVPWSLRSAFIFI